MARFNRTKASAPTEAQNYEGAPAAVLDEETALYALAVTGLIQDKFYAKSDQELSRLRGLLARTPHDFIAKLAVYCREEMFLRSMPVVLLVELAKMHAQGGLVRRAGRRIIKRVDEITEALAYFSGNIPEAQRKKLSKVPRQLKLALADAFARFDEYQFSKYEGAGKAVTLRDAMFLCHPKPSTDREELYRKIADKKLGAAFTWETELSAKGNTKENWEKLIDSERVGYMALLRNLRNILKAGVSDAHLERVCAYISDPAQVARSRQFPFRFYSAYKELTYMEHGTGFDRRVTEALEAAMHASALRIPMFAPEDRILVVCDVSGSMDNPISAKSKITLKEVGIVLAMLINSVVTKCTAVAFATEFGAVNLPSSNVLDNAEKVKQSINRLGGSTEGWKVIKWLVEQGFEYNKVLFFTDCQWWKANQGGYRRGAEPAFLWNEYKTRFPGVRGYYFDLAGYGTTPVEANPRTGMTFIAGWSDRVFDLITAVENGSTAVQTIKNMVL